MKVVKEVGRAPIFIGHNQMLVSRHEHDRVNIDVVAFGVDGKAIKVEFSESRIWMKQVGSSQGAAGNHFGSVGTNWTWQRHA